MEKVLSIIIPTYNMEKYLRQCLDSLIIPSIDAVEVLVVNDGSKDTSSVIAHEYSAKYPISIIVIDKENGNYGSCINRGLKEATGKYVKVLDADDSFDTNNFEQYVQQLMTMDIDLLLTDYIIVNEDGVKTRDVSFGLPKNQVLNVDDFCDKDEFTFQMHAVTYRTQILRDINYVQTEGVSYTDQEWIFLPVANTASWFYLPISVYRYLVGREGQTVSHKVAAKTFGIRLQLIKQRVITYRNNKANLSKLRLSYLKRKVVSSTCSLLNESIVNNLSLDLAVEFDQWLKSNGGDLYEAIARHPRATILGVNIITQWRQGYRTPWVVKIVRLLNKVLRR